MEYEKIVLVPNGKKYKKKVKIKDKYKIMKFWFNYLANLNNLEKKQFVSKEMCNGNEEIGYS